MRRSSFFGDRSGPSSPIKLLCLWIVPVICAEVAMYGLFVQQGLILEICDVYSYQARVEIYTFMLIRWHEYGCRESTGNHKLRYYPKQRPHKHKTSTDNEIATGSTLAQEILYGNLRGVYSPNP